MVEILSEIFSKETFKHMIKFAIVGSVGAVINFSILYYLTEFFKIYYIFSQIVGFTVAVTSNYILNKLWTFKRKIDEEFILTFFEYVFINLISLALNLCILFILVEFFKVWYIYAEVVATGFGFLVNFYGNKFWTFRYKKLRLALNNRV